MKLLKKENLTAYDINTLKINEKELLDNLLTLCELNKNIITGSGAETLKKIKDQLSVIEGQIESGNNNPIVKDELYKTLFKLVNFGAITEREARKHYKQICNDFF
jgi:sialic acid synthase SpsE